MTDSIRVEPLTCAIGAELHNVNLGAASRDAALMAQIRALLLKHRVLFFRDQAISRAEHVAFARCFGELEDHPVAGSDPEHPGLVRIYKSPDSPNDRYENSWHTDATWREKPPFGCVLRCVECPPVGGDTMWANMVLAYEHVPYAGSPPALQNLLGGQVDIMFDGMLTAMPLIKSGKLRAFGYTGSTRSRHLPDVPTMAELGHPQLQFVGWVGVIGPAKLPAAELAKIQAALQKAASAPAVQQKLFETGLEPQVNVDNAALARETREISDRNAGIVKKYGIKL